MSDTPLLPYDTAAAAAIWRRVNPAMPAYPTGETPLSAPSSTVEQILRRAIDEASATAFGCRRCGHGAPRATARALTILSSEAQGTLRSLLSAHYLLTGCWYQPALPPAPPESPAAALRYLYQRETALERQCTAGANAAEDGGLRRLLTQQAQCAQGRAERLMAVLENSLTIGNTLLKW